MPIECTFSIVNLSTEQFAELDYQVMRHAFDSQNELSRLTNEQIFQADIFSRLKAVGIEASREIPIRLSFESYSKMLFLDLVVASSAVYELKAVAAINDAHVGQLLNYLFLLDLRRGKLVNFGSASVESTFVNAPLTLAERRSFTVIDHAYHGENAFRTLIVELLRDWGTSLTLSLYENALVEIMGGPDSVIALLPIARNGVVLGNQRFHLAGVTIAFRLTAMNRGFESYKHQLATLLSHSPLKAIHWVNIAHHEVTFTTIQCD